MACQPCAVQVIPLRYLYLTHRSLLVVNDRNHKCVKDSDSIPFLTQGKLPPFGPEGRRSRGREYASHNFRLKLEWPLTLPLETVS